LFAKEKKKFGFGESYLNSLNVAESLVDKELSFGGFAYRSQSYATPAEFVAAQPSIVNLCHPNAHGIRQVAYNQNFPVLEIPGIRSFMQEELLLDFFQSIPIKAIIINGIPDKTVAFARYFYSQSGLSVLTLLAVSAKKSRVSRCILSITVQEDKMSSQTAPSPSTMFLRCVFDFS
jgi:hypothetical protein